MKISKFKLFSCFAQEMPVPEIGLKIIQSIERESGGGKAWNVKGICPDGKEKIVFVETEK